MTEEIIKTNALQRWAQSAGEFFFQAQFLFGSILALQLAWLLAIGLTGASTSWNLLAGLAVYSILSALLVVFIPDLQISKMIEWKNWLLAQEQRTILFLCVVALALGIVYAPIQRAWPDEGPSMQAASIIAREGWDGVITSYAQVDWLRYQHPPLMPLIYGLAVRIIGENMTLVRLISVLFMAGTTLITYFLGRELYGKEAGLLAAVVMLSFPLTVRLGTVTMMDMQTAFFFSLALLIFVYMLRRPAVRLALLAGIVIGLGLLTKYMMVFLFGVLGSWLVFSSQARKLWPHILVAGVISVAMLSGWLWYANQNEILGGQVERVLNFSGIYLLTKDTIAAADPALDKAPLPEEQAAEATFLEDVQHRIMLLGLETLFTRLPSSWGVHYIPLILLGAAAMLRRRDPSDRLILLWIGVVFCALFLTLPDHRYFLVTFPGIAIMIAEYMKRFPHLSMRMVILSGLFLAGAMVLFAGWNREALLFLPD